jgi:hypothetical protein
MLTVDDDWRRVTDIQERRKIQNRLAQRNYRLKLKRRLHELERRGVEETEKTYVTGTRQPQFPPRAEQVEEDWTYPTIVPARLPTPPLEQMPFFMPTPPVSFSQRSNRLGTPPLCTTPIPDNWEFLGEHWRSDGLGGAEEEDTASSVKMPGTPTAGMTVLRVGMERGGVARVSAVVPVTSVTTNVENMAILGVRGAVNTEGIGMRE